MPRDAMVSTGLPLPPHLREGGKEDPQGSQLSHIACGWGELDGGETLMAVPSHGGGTKILAAVGAAEGKMPSQ